MNLDWTGRRGSKVSKKDLKGQSKENLANDLYIPVHNVLDACISITRASGLVAISQGPKNSQFPGPNHLPLAHYARIQNIMHRAVLIIGA
jgi:hypothetical protein